MESLKEKGFISWLSEILNVKDIKQLDAEITKLGKDKLKQLANKFETEIWPIMEKRMVAKNGTKLDYITMLNGACPDGYEVEKFLVGGKTCQRCKKKAAKMQSGSTMSNIRQEIESKKCGGKTKKKKMQEGGKYNEDEHAKLLDKKRRDAISDKETARLQELNRTSGHHEDGWEPKRKITVKSITKETAQKAAENIKKHLNGGVISKFANGGGTRPLGQVGTSDTNRLFGRTDTEPQMLEEVVVTANRKPNTLGGGIYEYLVKKGAQSLASFAKRKQLAEAWGIENYRGTAEQNALLQRMFEHQFALAEMSNNTQGLRKGIDY